MPVFLRIKKVVLKHFMEMRWHSIVLAIALYIASSWLLLSFCGETALIADADFLYWIVVTASTVGYGDLSPATTPGKYAVALYVIPFGLSLFGLAVGRLAAFVSFQWRKGIQGLKNLNYENHILVIGWNGNRTLHLLRLLLRENDYNADQRRIALCVKDEMENPLPDRIGFVKVTSFSQDETMQKASLDKASCIIIDNPDDDITMTTALYCYSKNPNAHTIAYFKDEQLGSILQTHCPNVECTPSVAVEMLAKSAFDPGSSSLHHQLLDVDKGMTQYSIKYPDKAPVTSVQQLFSAFKESHDATLIGISTNGRGSMELNPPLERPIPSGSTLYYIADERINDVDWSNISGSAAHV